MRLANRRSGVIVLVTAAVLLAACGSNKNETSGGSASNRVAKIGVIAPLTGSLAPLGLGIKNSVDLAIKQANKANAVKGWTLQLADKDDTAKADVGATVASALASDKEVVGVVGTLNSSVALQVAPILDGVHVVQISPANTADEVTRGADFKNNPVRQHPNYFRVSTLDSVQGPFAADYVAKTLSIKKVAVVHDKKTYGQGLAKAFTERFKADGGTVTGDSTVNDTDQDFSAVISTIKPKAPGLIFYGGEFPVASLLSTQAKTVGLKVPLMGGDGIYDGKYIEVAKAAGEGDLATSVGAPVEQLDAAKSFVSTYAAAGYKDAFSAYGGYAFDAANVIIRAAAKVLGGKKAITDADRTAIIDAVQQTDTNGITGHISFDKFGDTTTKVLTVYKVTGGAWKPEKTANFQ
jgi:branched-chain amino acid transport system substrate-binding protein